jgi:hypothetical protein
MAGCLLGLLCAPAGASAPGPGSAMLRQSDLPGWTRVPASVETFADPNDYGIDQAFIACARGHVLLDQFDTGPGAVVGPVYGKGQNPFGTPELGIASIGFGDGSTSDAQAAEAVLAGPAFEKCWMRTTDRLNLEQGITTPAAPSTLQVLPNPHLGQRSAAFAFVSVYMVLGSRVHFQEAVTVVQKGPLVLMMIGLAYAQSFPLSVMDGAAAKVVERMGAPAQPPPAQPSLRACTAAGAPRHQVAVLTTPQVQADFHDPVAFASAQSGPPLLCTWRGAPLLHPTPFQRYAVQVVLALQFFGSPAGARAAATHFDAPFGPAQTVPGLGAQVSLQPGQDQVTQVLTIVTPSHAVAVVYLEQADNRHAAAIRSSLLAVGRQLIARLAQ